MCPFNRFPEIVLVLGIGSGCAVSAPPSTIVCGTCEETPHFVRLQSPANSHLPQGREKFSHPLKLDPEDWKLILAEIRVRPEGRFFKKTEEEPAFTEQDIGYLSMTLSRAFAKASPEQWVVFGLSTPTPASGHYMTTGAWYAKGADLHLLFSNVHAPVRMENLRQVLNKDPLYRVLEGTRYETIPTQFSRPYNRSEPASMFSFFVEETPHLVMKYDNLLAEAHENWATKTEKPLSDQSEENLDTPSDIEDRLATLKRLKEKQLITEEDYQRRKQELLDQL